MCCYVLSISALDKNEMLACGKQGDDGKCKDYENRPTVCREYKADEVCVLISTLPKDDKIRVLSSIYGVK